MTATFTITDVTGATFTYVKSDFTGVVWSDYLNNILSEFSGTPALGPAWMRVDTNFKVDGFLFINDLIFGGTSLPRTSCP